MPVMIPPQFKPTMPLGDLTVAYLRKHYLFDLQFVDNAGVPWPDDVYMEKINTAVEMFTEETEVNVIQKELTDEAHDYSASDYVQFSFLRTFEWPVIADSVVVKAKYPTGQDIITFPKEWLKIDEESGIIRMVPSAGSLSGVLIGQGGSFLPLVYQGMGSLPHLFLISYVAGYDVNKVPKTVIDCICKLAAIDLLTMAANTIYPPGTSSLSVGVDGLSQSMGLVNNGQLPGIFTGQIKLYRAQLYGGQGVGDLAQQGALQRLKDKYQGIKFVVG